MKTILIWLTLTLSAFSQNLDYSRIRNGPGLSVKAYGALGDGTHDDTTAIQAAINVAGGHTVTLPYGTYLTGALTMASDVALSCDPGTTFKFRDNNEKLFNTGSNVNRSGVSGNGGYCYLDPNGKTGTQAISILGIPSSSTNNVYRNLYAASGLSIFAETQNTYFNDFSNLRHFLPAAGGAFMQFETATTATKCDNCSVISGTPVNCFLIHNGGQITVSNSTCEGNAVVRIYQEDGVTFENTYFENSGGPLNTAWVFLGTATGTSNSGIAFIGSTFSVGANYSVSVTQVSGLTVTGSSLSPKIAAFSIDNIANAPKRGLNIGNNSYNINGLGYDQTKIIAYSTGSADNTNNSNHKQDVINPLLYTGTAEPPDASINNNQGAAYVNLSGILSFKYRDNAGTLHLSTTAPYFVTNDFTNLRVGINSSTPAAPLDVGADANNAVQIFRLDSTHFWCAATRFDNTNPDFYMIPNSCTNRANAAFTINASGNFGIGIGFGSILAKLHVIGNILATGNLQSNNVVAVASLPTCNAAAEGTRGQVNNALGPAYNTAVAGGGAVHVGVYCNGTTWISN